MSQVPSQYVHRGLWTNLEEGTVMGRTITTTTATGNLVIALLAILTTLGANHVWNLFTFAYHQLRADGRPADGLFRQQQALLRTLPDPGSMLVDWVKLWWTWRHTRFAFARSVVQMFLASLFFAMIIAAGIFSSNVVSSGTSIQVLVDSPLCGPINWSTKGVGVEDRTNLSRWFGKLASAARQYTRDCYGNSISSQSCASFTRPRIPLTVDRVDCPFGGLCEKMTKPAVKLDSGLVDLNEGFGWNLQDTDRVQYRQTTTCAVLDLAGRTAIAKAAYNGSIPGEEVLLIHLGGSFGTKGNVTSLRSLVQSNFTSGYFVDISTAFATPGLSTPSSLKPLQEMQRNDADISVISIFKNSVDYISPVDDPLFAAHSGRTIASTLEGQEPVTIYSSDFPVSAVGCAVQYQYCHSRASKPDFCTNLTGVPAIVNATAFPEASPIQLAAIGLIRESSADIQLDSAALVLQVDFLSEDPTGQATLHIGVPDNQWEVEIKAWVEYLWAAMQFQVADYAIGMDVRQSGAGVFVNKNMTDGEKALCSKLKMHNPGGFVNISVFGLAFTIAASLLASFLDIGLLRTLIFVKKLRHPRIDRWIQDGVFQLQRRAYEAAGEGPWRRLRKEIPTTVGTQRLGELPLSLVIDGKSRKYLSRKGRVFTDQSDITVGPDSGMSSVTNVSLESAEPQVRLGTGSFSQVRRTTTL